MNTLYNKILLCIFFLVCTYSHSQNILKCSDDGSGWVLKKVQCKWQKDKTWTPYENIKSFLFGKDFEANEKDIRKELFHDYLPASLSKFEGTAKEEKIMAAEESAETSITESNDLEIKYTYTSKLFKEPGNHHLLYIEELDPLAKIFLNNELIFTNQNYFIPVNITLPDKINTSDSFEIVIQFPPLPEAAKQMSQYDAFTFPSDNDPSEAASFFRKPAHQFGWDVCPRFLAGNLLTQTKIISWSNFILTNASVKQIHFNPNKATYYLELEISSEKETTCELKISFDEKTIINHKITLSKGKQTLRETITLNNPELWWPNGIFQQNKEKSPKLYKLKAELNNTGISKPSACYTYSTHIGVRSLSLERDKDVFGEKFQFKINEKPLFIKGANYVSEIFPNTGLQNDKEQLHSLLSNLRASGYNMIRVWGGGNYPSEDFLNYCDENGILLWQDFMFAGTLYPGDSAFLNNVKAEAAYQVQRIAQHPCLALWCGNNEIDVARKNWGWQETYKHTLSETTLHNQNYDSIFNGILPKAVKKYDGQTAYIHTSPLSNWGNKEDFYSGDNHYWGVWHGELPFESFEDHVPRFMSEYGFPSFPCMNTIRKYFGLTSDSLNDPAFKYRMRSYKGNELIKKYLRDYYGEAKDLESFVLLSQLQQAYAYKTAIEAQRRAKPFCMGTLYWQFNDAWPGITWSTIDYDQNKKASWFTVKEAYKNVILSAGTQRDFTEVYVISDLTQDTTAKIQITLMDFYGEKIFDSTFTYTLKANSSVAIFSKKTSALLKGKNQNEVVLVMRMLSEKKPYRNLFYYTRPKDLNLPKTEIKQKVKNNTLVFSSAVLVKDVYVEGKNSADIEFFDLLPGEKKVFFPEKKGTSSFRLFSFKEMVK